MLCIKRTKQSSISILNEIVFFVLCLLLLSCLRYIGNRWKDFGSVCGKTIFVFVFLLLWDAIIFVSITSTPKHIHLHWFNIRQSDKTKHFRIRLLYAKTMPFGRCIALHIFYHALLVLVIVRICRFTRFVENYKNKNCFFWEKFSFEIIHYKIE